MSVSPCARTCPHVQQGAPPWGPSPGGGESVSTGPRGRHSGGPDGGNARRSPHPQACKEAQGRARSTRAAGKERCCACAKSHRNPTAALARGGGLGKGGWGGKGRVSSTCLAAASSSPSVSCAGGRRAGSAAPAGSAPRGIWASPGNSASAGRSRTGGRRGRRRGGGGGGAAFPAPPPR